jgi:hypothetical protein
VLYQLSYIGQMAVGHRLSGSNIAINANEPAANGWKSAANISTQSALKHRKDKPTSQENRKSKKPERLSGGVFLSRCTSLALRSPTNWSWRRDLNPRPSDYKSDALPAELRQQNLHVPNCPPTLETRARKAGNYESLASGKHARKAANPGLSLAFRRFVVIYVKRSHRSKQQIRDSPRTFHRI